MTEERWDWRKLCAAVAKEQDETKLIALMEELLAVLEERETKFSRASRKQPLGLVGKKRGRISLS